MQVPVLVYAVSWISIIMSYDFKETIKNESIKICYWNIHGTKSEMIENKLLDAEFIQKLKNSDIVALSELHSEEKDPFSCLRIHL